MSIARTGSGTFDSCINPTKKNAKQTSKLTYAISTNKIVSIFFLSSTFFKSLQSDYVEMCMCACVVSKPSPNTLHMLQCCDPNQMFSIGSRIIPLILIVHTSKVHEFLWREMLIFTHQIKRDTSRIPKLVKPNTKTIKKYLMHESTCEERERERRFL